MDNSKASNVDQVGLTTVQSDLESFEPFAKGKKWFAVYTVKWLFWVKKWTF